MTEPLVVTATVRVPAHALSLHTARASGPGGQNVNKVASKVELRLDIGAIEGLTATAVERLRVLARHRVDAEGRLRVTSQATRNQARNVQDARDKLCALIAAALREPRRRRKTAPPAKATERRLEAKQRRARLKRARARPAEAE